MNTGSPQNEPASECEITAVINGVTVQQRVPCRQNLVDFLRENMGLTGTHIGCEHGVCGACTVRIDGRIARGCLTLAVQADGATIETIEHVSDLGEILDLQEAFLTCNALQCGFCTPGILLTSAELLQAGRELSRESIRTYISGNVCRCTGYEAIVNAIEMVMRRRRAQRIRTDTH
jgi:carbon-monoxide dehydrogenase small subunit